MERSDIQRRSQELRVIVAMHWIRGVLYALGLGAAAYLLKPLIPVIGRVTGNGWAWLALLVLVILVPLLLGWFGARFVNPLVRNWQNFGGMARWEDRIVKELAPDDQRGFFVVLVPWPSRQVRTMALLTNTHEGADGTTLASVYLPGIPEARHGAMRVVAIDDLEFTDWTFMDLMNHSWSYGSNSPSELGKKITANTLRNDHD